MRGVLGRVERGQLVAERQVVAVLLDDLADVVAFERHREPGERSDDRVAVRERRGVVQHRHGFVVARHHDDAVMRFPPDRPVVAQVVVVRVRVLIQRARLEEVDRVEVGSAHRAALSKLISTVTRLGPVSKKAGTFS